MNAPASQVDEDRPRVGAIKFTYASGARPLEGYTIKRGVGRGGFGEVYFATSDAGKEVALKLIRRNLDVELRGVTQCLNLKHPNLIGLYDIRTDEIGDQWVIMEYVSGESLEEVIERNPNGVPIEQALWWMRGIGAGVSYLHDHGIVHRDLKPGNIFSDEGVVKIGDYGLAKFISCSRRSGQTESVGTVHYMAPEIANGRYGREIDTYALGIILFEMLTGHVPFEGESVGEVLMKHLTAEPDLSRVDEPYRDIVRRALTKDPEVRLKTVNELLALLPGGGGATPFVPTFQQPNAAAAAEFSPGAAARQAFAASPSPAAGQTPPAVPGVRVNARMQSPRSSKNAHVIEEPIVKAIRDWFASIGFGRGNENAPASPLPKALLIFGIIACLLIFGGEVFKVFWPIAMCYLVYYIIWASAIRPGLQRQARAAAEADAEPAVASAEQAAGYKAANALSDTPADGRTALWTPSGAAANTPVNPSPIERPRRMSWRDRAQQELAAKPAKQKFSELVGTMILAALFAAIGSCVVPLVLSDTATNDRFAVQLWVAIVATLGSWAVLVPAKFAEGKLEDQAPMRLTLMSFGAIVGLVACLLSQTLLIHLPSWRDPVDTHVGLISHEMLGWPARDSALNPALPVFMAYFAFLFLLPRWWRQGESTREGRVRVWWVIGSVFWAWLLHFFWWFPQPAGMMVAGVMSVAIQLASPWMAPSQRRAIAEGIERTA